MEDWKKGDIAVCINTGSVSDGPGSLPPLRLKAEYIVNDIFECRCGCSSLDVGFASTVVVKGTTCICGVNLPYPDTHWCYSLRFVRKRTKEELEAALNEAIFNEDYFVAETIKEMLNKH